MGKRLNLKQFRVSKDMTQAEFAAAMGVTRSRYQQVESGARFPEEPFWHALQKTFGIPDEKMWRLMRVYDEVI